MKQKLKEKFNAVKSFIIGLSDDNVDVYAAQASFFLIISSIPFLLLIFTVIKLFWNIDPQLLIRSVQEFMPNDISAFITPVLTEIFDKSTSIPVISVTAVITLLLASNGISALSDGLSKLHDTEPLNFFMKPIYSVVFTLVLIFSFLMIIAVFGFGASLNEYWQQNISFFSYIMKFILSIRIVILFLYLTLIFAMFYKFLPRLDCSYLSLFPGAMFAAVGWIIFSYLYKIYIQYFANYTYFYGSLAAIVMLMLWIYICMKIFLYGAQINKMKKNQKILN